MIHYKGFITTKTHGTAHFFEGQEEHPETLATNPDTNLVQGLSGVKDVVASIGIDAHNKPYNPFPEGLVESKIPDFIRESWRKVQEHGLSIQKQQQISYYEKNGEWFINLDGIKISMQNESAESNSSVGINVEGGNTYFSQSSAQTQAKNKGKELPTNVIWEKMEQFLGGVEQLRDVLQLSFTGWFHPGGGLYFVGHFAGIWSAVDGHYFYIYATFGSILPADNVHLGLGVRLLDKTT